MVEGMANSKPIRGMVEGRLRPEGLPVQWMWRVPSLWMVYVVVVLMDQLNTGGAILDVIVTVTVFVPVPVPVPELEFVSASLVVDHVTLDT